MTNGKMKDTSILQYTKFVLIALIILSYYDYFYLFNGPRPWILIGAYFLISLLSLQRITVSKYVLHIMLFILWFLIQVAVTAFRYNEKILSILLYNYKFAELFLSWVIYDYLKESRHFHRFIMLLTSANLIYSVLLLAQLYILVSTRIYIMNIEGMVSGRGGNPRFIGAAVIHCLVFCILCGLLNDGYFDKKWKKKICVITLLLSFAAQFLFVQTRMLEIMMLCVMLVNFWNYHGKNRIWHYLLKTLLVLIIAALVVVEILVLSGSNILMLRQDYSVDLRIQAVKYFVAKILENPIWGIGLITDDINGVSSLLHGSNGMLYASDVGIIGLVVRMGIIGGIWYIISIVQIGKIAFAAKVGRNLAMSTFIFSGLSVFTISLLHNSAIFAFPIIYLLVTKYITFSIKNDY